MRSIKSPVARAVAQPLGQRKPAKDLQQHPWTIWRTTLLECEKRGAARPLELFSGELLLYILDEFLEHGIRFLADNRLTELADLA